MSYSNIAYVRCVTVFANPIRRSFCWRLLYSCPPFRHVMHILVVTCNLTCCRYVVLPDYQFLLDCCYNGGHVTYDFGRLCGPGGWSWRQRHSIHIPLSRTISARYCIPSLSRTTLQSLPDSLSIVMTVFTGLKFRGLCFLDYETCCRIRDGTADVERKAKHVWTAWNRPIPVGLRPLACWDCVFEPCRRHGCLSLVSVVCCEIEVSVLDRSLVQRSPTDCGVSECDREASTMKRPWLTGTFVAWGGLRKIHVRAIIASRFSTPLIWRRLSDSFVK
jgi:hypothetical protein